MLLRKAAGDLMSEEVLTAEETQTVSEVTKKMGLHNIGAVMVLNKTHEPIGIFTERDLLKRVVAPGLDPKTTPLSKVMTSKFTSVKSDSDIEDLTEIMVEGNFRHLPIVDQKKLVGIISIKDLARYLAGLPPKKMAASGASNKLD
jgi:CBS domain-containing protein